MCHEVIERCGGLFLNLEATTDQRLLRPLLKSKIVSEYDQEIPQSQTADKPMAQRGRATQQSRYTRKTN